MNIIADIKFFIDLVYELAKEFAKIATIFVAGTSFGFVKNVIRLRIFKQVFGSIAAENDGFIICLPLWKAIESSRDTVRFSKVGLDGNVYSYHGPNDTISQHDNESANELSVLYHSIFVKPISVVTDNENFNYNKSIIFIGSPIANIRIKSFLESYPNKYIDFIVQDESDNHKSAIGIFDRSNNTIYDSGSKVEYSVITRSKNPQCEKGFLFIIGGAHAEGTLAAARHVRINWKNFAKYDDEFAIILEMPRGNIAFPTVKICYGAR